MDSVSLIIFYFFVVIALGAEAGRYFYQTHSNSSGEVLRIWLAVGILVLGAYLLKEWGFFLAILLLGLSAFAAYLFLRQKEEKKLDKKRKKREHRLSQPKSSRRFAQRR